MPKTIFITGASSGIGQATALHFARRGWQVVATMRRPQEDTLLTSVPNVKLLSLDVLDHNSIAQAVAEALRAFGSIDVLFNNAGYGLVGAFETMTEEQIKKEFEVNLFGVMRVTRALLPAFRAQKYGTIITTSSMGGRLTFPLYSVYNATKWAVEGFMESLQFELCNSGVRVKLVEPGAIKTDFYSRSMEVTSTEQFPHYTQYSQKVHANMHNIGSKGPGPEVVAKKVFQAATDNSSRLRYPVGGNGPMLLFLRWILPLSWFQACLRLVVEK